MGAVHHPLPRRVHDRFRFLPERARGRVRHFGKPDLGLYAKLPIGCCAKYDSSDTIVIVPLGWRADGSSVHLASGRSAPETEMSTASCPHGTRARHIAFVAFAILLFPACAAGPSPADERLCLGDADCGNGETCRSGRCSAVVAPRDAGPPDAGPIAPAPPDGGPVDGGPPDAGTSIPDAGALAPDGGRGDAGLDGGAGQLGDACTRHDQCASQICLASAQRCSALCSDGCPAEWSCVDVVLDANRRASVCVPPCDGGACLGGGCTNHDACGTGRFCTALDGGACADCAPTNPARCGTAGATPGCATCSGSTPVCRDGACICSSNADCGSGRYCAPDGRCTSCSTTDSLVCGTSTSSPGCTRCSAATPICRAGACVCGSDADCGAGSYCASSGRCEGCAFEDPLRCGTASSPAGCTRCPAGDACRTGQCLHVPAAPTLIDTLPSPPNSELHPRVRGLAEAGTLVRVYKDAACAAAQVGLGSATDLAASGIAVTVTPEAETTLWARAELNGLTSACEGGTVRYVHDGTAPATQGAFVVDGSGADLTYQSSRTEMRARWGGFTGDVAHYNYNLSTSSDCLGNIVGSAQVGTATQKTTGVLLTHGQLYFNCVQAVDAAGNASAWVASDGVIVDIEPPSVPPTLVVSPGIHEMALSWEPALDPVAGVASYEVGYCSPAPCALPAAAQSPGLVGRTLAVAPLPCPSPYSFGARAVDRAGNVGPWAVAPATRVLCRAGQLDGSFGDRGLTQLSLPPFQAIIRDAGGRYVLSVAPSYSTAPESATLARLSSQGLLDTTFGLQGVAGAAIGNAGRTSVFQDTFHRLLWASAGKHPDLCGGSNSPVAHVLAFTPTGTRSLDYGEQGLAVACATATNSASWSLVDSLLASNGRLLALAPSGSVFAFNATGAVDSAFGISGRAATEALDEGGLALAEGAGGSIHVLVNTSVDLGAPLGRRRRGLLWRLTESGAPDPQFGTGGRRVLSFSADPGDQSVHALGVLGNGIVYVAGAPWGLASRLTRLRTDGSSDASFGQAGTVSLPITATSILPAPGGGLFLLDGHIVQWLEADGSPHREFGVDGIVDLRAIVGSRCQIGVSSAVADEAVLVLAGSCYLGGNTSSGAVLRLLLN